MKKHIFKLFNRKGKVIEVGTAFDLVTFTRYTYGMNFKNAVIKKGLTWSRM